MTRNALLIALAVLLLAASLHAQTTAPTTAPSSAAVVRIEGMIDDYSRDQIFKNFAKARAAGATTVIVEFDTYGGMVTSALDISRFLKNQNDLRTIAYVNSKAISAGAMLALACDEIVMSDSAVIGDCAPISVSESGSLEPMPAAERAKSESPILADFYDSATRNHHDPLLTAAMVSVGRVVHWIESEEGERKFVDADQFKKLTAEGWKSVEGEPNPLDRDDTLLTVHTRDAIKLGLAKSAAPSATALANERNLTIAATYAPHIGEKFVGFLGGALVRMILLTIFLQSLYLALATPGHGAPEAIALTSICLLLGVPVLTGYAQWWEVLLIFAGLALVVFEIFVIPGHFVAGTVGVLMMIFGLVLTFVGKEPGGPALPSLNATWTAMKQGLFVVTGGLSCSLFLWFWLSRYLPKLPYFNRLILTTTNGELATSGASLSESTGPAVGDAGVAVTDLKPGGSVRFVTDEFPDGRLAGVVSDTGFVPAGSSVIVQEVAGNRIVVRPDTVEARMTLATWAAVLFAVAIVLLVSELLLPTHGILGVLGAGCILATIGICFAINSWLGLGTLVATAIATPFAFAGAMQIWPKTPIGKRMMLPPIDSHSAASIVQVGESGRSVSELRPMGVCEFESGRVEALSEAGIIAAGRNVKVVALTDNRPIVRET